MSKTWEAIDANLDVRTELVRYKLEIDWSTEGEERHMFLAILMNPSIADDQISDPTVERVLTFVRKEKNSEGGPAYNFLSIVNCCTTVGSDSKKIDFSKIGEDVKNEEIIINQMNDAKIILLAWGEAPHKAMENWISGKVTLKEAFENNKVKLRYFKKNDGGGFTHPGRIANEEMELQKIKAGDLGIFSINEV